MKTRVLLTIILVSLSAIAAMLPQKKNSSLQLSARELLQEINLGTYKISPDQLTEIIINNDPGYMLIDIRPADEFEKFSLPGAINIPFDSLFTDNWIAYIDQDLRKNLFYSNGSTLSNQALILTRQKGFKNNFSLEGGLNGWFENVIKATPPSLSVDNQELVLYKRRLAAQQFFKGGRAVEQGSSATSNKPVPMKKKKMVQGGCS
jgi:rhodanese-related sulfurtransferase